jgi:Zn-dependent protease
MHGSFKVARVAGIDIRLHYTWLIAIFLIAWSLALGYFPMSGNTAGPVTYWALGIVAAVLLFASVLVHELAHSLVARSRGLRVDNITLFIFGGVSSITREPSSARDEFLVAVVGPLTSLLLAALFWVLSVVVPPTSAPNAVLGYLAYANLLLGIFNIVPGFPLDGGRVLRSIVWLVTGNANRATQIASYVGQAVAFVLIAWGVLRLVSGDVSGGIWIAFIGWFLNSGAEASRHESTVRTALAGVSVQLVMDTSREHLPVDVTVRDFVLGHAVHGRRALPVLKDGELVGIMSISDAKHLNQEDWATMRVGDVMTRAPLKTLGPDADLAEALELMVENDIHQVPIVQGRSLLGMLSRSDVMRHMQGHIDQDQHRPVQGPAVDGQQRQPASPPASA